jgi:hypothetical protein
MTKYRGTYVRHYSVPHLWRRRKYAAFLCVWALVILPSSAECASWAQRSDPAEVYGTAIDEAFRGCATVDLRTSRAKPVVTLRDKYGIPPSSEPVLVKVIDPHRIPDALASAFANPNVRGVTINRRYIAILRTDFAREYHDILDHELVHAYISLASPKALPFWFQEASAVFFSTNKTVSFYGRATDTPGQMIGKTSELTDVYKRKLQNFRFLSEYVGEARFRHWYTHAVVTGDVNARQVLGLSENPPEQPVSRSPVPVVALGVSTAGVLALGGVAALFFSRRKKKLIITIE